MPNRNGSLALHSWNAQFSTEDTSKEACRSVNLFNPFSRHGANKDETKPVYILMSHLLDFGIMSDARRRKYSNWKNATINQDFVTLQLPVIAARNPIRRRTSATWKAPFHHNGF